MIDSGAWCPWSECRSNTDMNQTRCEKGSWWLDGTLVEMLREFFLYSPFLANVSDYAVPIANNAQTSPAVTSVVGAWHSSRTCPVDFPNYAATTATNVQTAAAPTGVEGAWWNSGTYPVDDSNYTATTASSLQEASPDGRQGPVDDATATMHGLSPWTLTNVKSQAVGFTFSDQDARHAGRSHSHFQSAIDTIAFSPQSLVNPEITVCGQHDSTRQASHDADDGFQSPAQGSVINAQTDQAATSPG